MLNITGNSLFIKNNNNNKLFKVEKKLQGGSHSSTFNSFVGLNFLLIISE